MPEISYTHQLKANGSVVAELDCEVDCHVYLENGEPDWTIYEVRVCGLDSDGDETFSDLTKSDDPALIHIGRAILEAVQKDDDVFDRACDAAGIYFDGRNGNDPNGSYRHEAA